MWRICETISTARSRRPEARSRAWRGRVVAAFAVAWEEINEHHEARDEHQERDSDARKEHEKEAGDREEETEGKRQEEARRRAERGDGLHVRSFGLGMSFVDEPFAVPVR